MRYSVWPPIEAVQASKNSPKSLWHSMCRGASCWYCYKDGEGGQFKVCEVEGGIPFAGEGQPHCASLLEDATGVSHLAVMGTERRLSHMF